MINAGLFSTIYLDSVQEAIACTDEAQGRLVTLSQSWARRDASGAGALWTSFVKAALGNLGFVIEERTGVRAGRGLHMLHEDFSFQSPIALLYLVEPDADLDDSSVGRFWPAKLINALRERKLNWGILTDGRTWRLYSTNSAKPYEDHVQLDLGSALESQDETAYALFERFFHAECFVPVDRDDYESEKARRFKDLGLKAKRQKRAESGTGDDDETGPSDSDAEQERRAGIYLSRLDLDGEVSEGVLEAWVKAPLLGQVDGVLRYICNGFIADTPRTGDAYTEDERREVFESSVKLLYRCLFLFYAEARRLLPSEDRHAAIYAPHSIRALCEEARKFRWSERTDHSGYDLWQHLKGLVQAVNEGDPGYGILGYNGGLFDDDQERFLGRHRLRNDFLWPALYWLAYVDPYDWGQDEEYAIPYQDLEVRHLGEMYEAILEYKVRLADTDYLRRRGKNGWQTLPAAGQKAQEGDIRIKAGDIFFGETALERKQSGSYYTPESLVRFLVDKAVIQPLRERWESACGKRFAEYLDQTRAGFDEAARRGALRAAEEMIHEFVRREVLTYQVCDPAMGSGHFLVATANLMGDFVAGLLARIEPITGAPSGITGAPNHWRRLVTRHCLYGADLNPLAVNLAKLALWLNCFARDHKLTFLDHHLRCGNSLIGLRDLGALKKIPLRRKDGKRVHAEIKAAEHDLPLGLGKALEQTLAAAAGAIRGILDLSEDDTDRQRDAFEDASNALHSAFAPLADLHTAYLMDSTIVPADYARLLAHFAEGGRESAVPLDLREVWERVKTLRERHDFFHWPLEFPEVFGGEGNGGFSATVGNPPWDMASANPEDFFHTYDPQFRTLDRNAVIKRVGELCSTNPGLARLWESFQESINEINSFFAEPAAYSHAPSGRNNLFQFFLLRFFEVTSRNGNMSIVVPSGIYTDKGCTPIRKYFFEKSSINFLYSFENRWPTVFSAVDSRFKFVALGLKRGRSTTSISAAFMQHDPQRLPLIEETASLVSYQTIQRLSPKSLAVLEFESATGTRILEMLYSENPTLSQKQANSWNSEFTIEYMSNTDGVKFETIAEGLIPVIAGKHFWQFDHQFSNLDRGVSRSTLKSDFGASFNALERFRITFRDIAASTNERTCISSIVSGPCVCLETARVINVSERTGPRTDAAAFLLALLNSFTVDYVVRRMVTSHLSQHIMERIPIPRLGCGDPRDATYFWPVVARALRLVCTTEDYADLWSEVFPQIPDATRAALASPPPAYGPAHEQALRERLAASYTALDATWTPACGLHDRNPDRRDTGDRAQTRAEIDALVAHLYGLTRDEFAYILDTFPVLRRKEQAAFGEYQSKRKALEEFDRFQR